MKRMLTIFLRLAVVLMGLTVLALCIFALPGLFRPDNADMRPVAVVMYVTAVPFFVALAQTLKLLGLIDNNRAFSAPALKSLSYIKQAAALISLVYVVVLPVLYDRAQYYDAPGILAIGMLVAGASAAIAVFTAIVSRLLKAAIAIKSENELTV